MGMKSKCCEYGFFLSVLELDGGGDLTTLWLHPLKCFKIVNFMLCKFHLKRSQNTKLKGYSLRLILRPLTCCVYHCEAIVLNFAYSQPVSYLPKPTLKSCNPDSKSLKIILLIIPFETLFVLFTVVFLINLTLLHP